MLEGACLEGRLYWEVDSNKSSKNLRFSESMQRYSRKGGDREAEKACGAVRDALEVSSPAVDALFHQNSNYTLSKYHTTDASNPRT